MEPHRAGMETLLRTLDSSQRTGNAARRWRRTACCQRNRLASPSPRRTAARQHDLIASRETCDDDGLRLVATSMCVLPLTHADERDSVGSLRRRTCNAILAGSSSPRTGSRSSSSPRTPRTFAHSSSALPGRTFSIARGGRQYADDQAQTPPPASSGSGPIPAVCSRRRHPSLIRAIWTARPARCRRPDNRVARAHQHGRCLGMPGRALVAISRARRRCMYGIRP